MNTLAVWLVCEFTRCVVGLSAGWFMWSWCDNCYRQDEQDINNTIYELFKFFYYYDQLQYTIKTRRFLLYLHFPPNDSQ